MVSSRLLGCVALIRPTLATVRMGLGGPPMLCVLKTAPARSHFNVRQGQGPTGTNGA